MKTFEYRGYRDSGAVVRGLIEALDVKEVRERLAQQGVSVHRVKAAGHQKGRRKQALGAPARAVAYQELAALLRSGLPLAGALDILISSPEMGSDRGRLAAVRDLIREGTGVAEALKQADVPLSDFEASVIEAGEDTGSLADVLEEVAAYLEEQQGLRDKILSAMIYPAIVFTLVLLLGAGILFFMLPGLEKLLIENNMMVPPLTRLTLKAGVLAKWLLPFAALGLLAAGYRIRRQVANPGGRIVVHRRFFSIPLVRKPYTDLVNIRFARTLL